MRSYCVALAALSLGLIEAVNANDCVSILPQCSKQIFMLLLITYSPVLDTIAFVHIIDSDISR